MIKNYIQVTISTVSLSNICDEFGVDTNELYRIFKETTPGEFIRFERMKIVRRMRREKPPRVQMRKARTLFWLFLFQGVLPTTKPLSTL